MTNDDSRRPILVALPQAWDDDIQNKLLPELEQNGFDPIYTPSPDEAAAIIKSQPFEAVILYSDWALSNLDETSVGLIKLLKGKTPTITVISPKTFRKLHNRFFDELYFPPMHEYVTTPFGVEELMLRLKKTLGD